MNDYLPFYGSEDLEMFQIERSAMDRAGLVIAWLDSRLPSGRILDIGAGNGFTASRLSNNRRLTCVEPSERLPNFDLPVQWVKATAETLPFHDAYFDAAYATWAYFLPGVKKDAGFIESARVIKDGGSLLVIGNAGDDEFSSFSADPASWDAAWFAANGFEAHLIVTSFEFECVEDAKRLMEFYFGEERMRGQIKTTYEYRVVAYQKIIERETS